MNDFLVIFRSSFYQFIYVDGSFMKYLSKSQFKILFLVYSIIYIIISIHYIQQKIVLLNRQNIDNK